MNINKIGRVYQQCSLENSLNQIGNLEEKIWSKLKIGINGNKKKPGKKKFMTHPNELCSDSDLSLPVTPNFITNCSSDSHVDLLYQNENFKNPEQLKAAKKPKNVLQSSDSDSVVNASNTINVDWHVMGDGLISDQLKRKNMITKTKKNVKILLEKNYSTPSNFIQDIISTKTKIIRQSKTVPVVKRKKDLDSKIKSKKSILNMHLPRENFDMKLRNILQKILKFLEEISKLTDEGEIEPDGNEDMERRKKRAIEFSARFSRNYLYPLGRYLTEIDTLTRSETAKSLNQYNSNMQQKLIASHQIVLQSLQAYHSHIPTSSIRLTFDKLLSLLAYSTTLCNVHRNNLNLDYSNSGKRESLIEAFEIKSKLLCDKINETNKVPSTSTIDKTVRSTGTKLSLTSQHSRMPKQRRKALNNRLSMYMIPNNLPKDSWKKSAANLAKKRFNVPSRYKIATFKHRPQAEPLIIEPSRLTFCDKRSSGNIRSTPICTPINEDTIETLVESENKKEQQMTDGLKLSIVSHENNENNDNEDMNSIIKELAEQTNKNRKDMSQKQLENILVQLLSMVRDQNKNEELKEKTNKVSATEIRHETDQNANFCNQLTNLHNKSDGEDESRAKINDKSSLDSIKKLKKQPSIRITGAKNAKLICMTDENYVSDVFSSENGKKNDLITCETQTELNLNQINFGSCELVYKEQTISTASERISKTNIKIGRLPQISRKTLALLPKDYVLNIIEYKLQFRKHTKGNHMYKKTSIVQPWLLIGKISDKLLDFALLSVAREIELNEIIETLYYSEFQ